MTIKNIQVSKYDELRDTTRQYIQDQNFDLNHCLAVTLTMKQFSDNERLDHINAPRNMRHFLNRMNKYVYGNSAKRFNRKIKVIAVLEKSERLHYHLLIEIPKYADESRHDLESFKQALESTWLETKFGYHEIDIQDVSSCMWLDYITKFKSSEDTIDWSNVNF